MLRSSERGLIPSSAQSIGFRLQSLHRRLRFAQPGQELVQRPVEVVERVHRGVQQFPSIDDAGNGSVDTALPRDLQSDSAAKFPQLEGTPRTRNGVVLDHTSAAQCVYKPPPFHEEVALSTRLRILYRQTRNSRRRELFIDHFSSPLAASQLLPPHISVIKPRRIKCDKPTIQ